MSTLFRYSARLMSLNGLLLKMPDNCFTFNVDTTKGNGFNSFQLPFRAGRSYDCYVDFGDGTGWIHITAYNQAETLHTYATSGIYTVKVKGYVGSWYDNNSGDVLKYIECSKFGSTEFGDIDAMFYGAANLKITTDFGPYAPNSTYCNSFLRASGIDFIPRYLLKHLTSCVQLTYHMYQCPNLTGSIPDGYLDSCTNVTNLDRLFASTNISGTIPPALIHKCTKLVAFTNVMSGCGQLTGMLDADFFAFTPLITSISSSFLNCTGLNGCIPATLLHPLVNLTTCVTFMAYCTGLMCEIPEQLLWYCPKLTSTNGLMRGCTGLTYVYEDMLRYNPMLVNVGLMLDACTSLQGSIPSLYYNPNVTTVAYYCNGMRNCAIPAIMFNLNEIYRYIDMTYFCRVTDVAYSHTGTLQDFWNYTNPSGKSTAFLNCIALTNYDILRTNWP